MELYRRFSYKAYTRDFDNEKLDTMVSDALNEKIAIWAKEMKAKHPHFKFRIVNADSVPDSSPSTQIALSIELATAVIHVLYEID